MHSFLLTVSTMRYNFPLEQTKMGDANIQNNPAIFRTKNDKFIINEVCFKRRNGSSTGAYQQEDKGGVSCLLSHYLKLEN